MPQRDEVAITPVTALRRRDAVRPWRILVAAFCVSTATAVEALEVPKFLRACSDENGFPPFTFTPRDAPAEKVTGYHVELLTHLLALEGRSLEIVPLPWMRCIVSAARGEFDIVIDAARSGVRERDLKFPRASYRLTNIVLFHRDRPIPPPKSADDLAQWNRCEMFGWDYSTFVLPSGSGGKVVARPYTVDAAAELLRIGRCQVMGYQLESLGSRTWVGKPDPLGQAEFGYHLLPWTSAIGLHAGVSARAPYAAELTHMIDSGLAQMQHSAWDRRLRAKYRLP